ncbi:MAG: sulfotransferase family protein [Nitrosomonadaceae bacterium]
MQDHKYIFIGGLHRSGTWLQTHCMEGHSKISRLARLDEKGRIKKLEGQYLQTVYPDDSYYGGVGQLGFHPEIHLTEESSIVTVENRKKLFEEWGRYWDLSKPYLLEKTPANLLRSRFLQAMFPSSCFVFVVRHPVAVALAQQKWSGTSLMSLIEHWLICYETLREDAKYLKNYIVVRYEDFIKDPASSIERSYRFLGLDSEPYDQKVDAKGNDNYFKIWERACRSKKNTKSLSYRIIWNLMPYAVRYGYPITLLENEVHSTIRRYEARANSFGYSLIDLEAVGDNIGI